MKIYRHEAPGFCMFKNLELFVVSRRTIYYNDYNRYADKRGAVFHGPVYEGNKE